jgi:hypothetical protein
VPKSLLTPTSGGRCVITMKPLLLLHRPSGNRREPRMIRGMT